MKSLIPILILLAAFSCREQAPQPAPNGSYELWRSNNLHNYTFDQVRICFCMEGGTTMRITVRADTINSISRVNTGTFVSPPNSTWYMTIDSLFGIINNPGTDSLITEFNAAYGYPTKLDINPQQHPVDGGVLILCSNLQIP